jgi:ATP-dependent exoDNAse (exonuclease V) beta subunit
MSAPKDLPPDANARRRALLDHNTTLLVEAGAGTGKTALMAGRIALLVAGGVAPRDVVAITFTEAASSELRERIERYVTQLAISVIPKELDVAVMGGLLPEQLANVKAAASTLDELTCTTIHGFCQQIVRAYPVEASIDPGAVIIDPDAADLAYDDLLFAWLSARFGRDRSKEGLGRLPPVPEKGEDDFFAELMIDDPDGIVEIVRQTAQFLRGKRAIGAPAGELDKAVLENLAKATAAFKAWYAGCKIEEEKTAGLIDGLASFGSTLAEAAAAPLTGRALARLLLHDAPKCVHSSEPRFSKWGNKGKWIDAAKAAGKGKPHGEQLNSEASQHYDTCSGLYRTFVESVAGAAIARFIKEFEPLTQLYDDYKRQAALLDFDDLLHHARDLLACHDTVRRDLGKRYSRILVDEFQDTDPLQAEILWLLCGEGDSKQDWTQRKLRPGSLFSVGDPKQAIYRFRGADVDTYLRAKAALLEQSPDSVIHITSNFRSVEPIITFANARFAPLLTEEKGQPGFKELAAMRSAAGTLPHVAAIDVACCRLG